MLNSGLLRAADARPEVAPHPASLHQRFDLIGPDYKKPQELPASFFNPFKSQTSIAALARKEVPSVTNEAVTDAVTKRGISGIVLAADLRTNRVVLGDEVFAVDDELSFADPRQSEPAPLLAGASVVLKAIRSENLEFEIRVEGEPPRTMTFPLRRFWSR